MRLTLSCPVSNQNQALEVLRGPVAIDAIDGGGAVARHLGQQLLYDGCLCVIGVNQDGQFLVVVDCHSGPSCIDAIERG